MKLEHISYKTLTIFLLLAVAALSLLQTLLSKQEFSDATRRAQTRTLSRIIEVASNESLKNLRTTSYAMGSSLQTRLVDPQSKELLPRAKLQFELDDIAENGFVGMRLIDLIKLRVFDPQLQLVAESSRGPHTLPAALPPFLIAEAQSRQGVERLKAAGGLWHTPAGPLYSLLVPIGGLHLIGYLEVMVDPGFNLGAVAEMTQLPLRITTVDGTVSFASPDLPANGTDGYLMIDYQLNGTDQQPLYRLTAYENISGFNDELQTTQLRNSLLITLVTLIVLALVMVLLNRFLFRPVSNLIVNVEQSINGELDTVIEEHGVKEVHIIARAFNLMSRTIRNNMAELERLSSSDGLTGIANRRAFDSRLEHEWARALRHQTPLALMLIDIDYFKRYNDTLGHQAGDHCLREIAQLLQLEMRRPTDIVARYGGEEFVVLLPETDRFGAGIVALKLRDALHARAIAHPASEVSPLVTMSIGVNVMIPARGEYLHTLIERADKALYEAKRAGRNSVRFATPEAGPVDKNPDQEIIVPLQ